MTSDGQGGDHWDDVRAEKEAIVEVGRKTMGRGKIADAIDLLGATLANPLFLLLMVVTHVGWVVYNSGWLPVPVIDPYPFTFLATVASVEAPFISLLILMYQRRHQRVAEAREETDLLVALHDERETTRLIQLVSDMHRAMGLRPDRHDEILERMKQPLDSQKVVDEIDVED